MYASTLMAVYSIAITVAMYAISRVLAREISSPLTAPLFLATTLIILMLSVDGFADVDYAPARELMTFLLGPATVALAVPVYKNRRVLLAHAAPVLAGLVAGSVTTVFAAALTAGLFHAASPIVSSVFLKSVTAPVAVEVARIFDGNPSLTVGLVIAAGLLGAMLGPWLLNRFGVHHPLARGLALGTIAHAQGVARAETEGELPGAAAGIAMVIAAVLAAFTAPVFIGVLK